MLAPSLALRPLMRAPAGDGAELGFEVSRWFGSLGVTFGSFLLWRVLDHPGALRPVLEALLLGDVLYLGSLAPFAIKFGKWPAILAPFALTAIMFAARLTYLLCEDWPLLEIVVSRVSREKRGKK